MCSKAVNEHHPARQSVRYEWRRSSTASPLWLAASTFLASGGRLWGCVIQSCRRVSAILKFPSVGILTTDNEVVRT